MVDGGIVVIYMLCGVAWVCWRCKVNHSDIEQMDRECLLPPDVAAVGTAIAVVLATILWPYGLVRLLLEGEK